MSQIANPTSDPVPAIAGAAGSVPAVARPRPVAAGGGPVGWARQNLFGSIGSSITTIVLAVVIAWFVWNAFGWAVLHAVWSVPTTAAGTADTTACRAVQGIGACWALLHDKGRFILFGFYPYDQQWRPACCVVLFLFLYGITMQRRMWRKELALVWIAILVAIGILMWGGILGLPYVSEDQWGGLPITLILSTFGLAIAFPLAVLVALGRRSRRLPAVKTLCVVYVELVRGVPLVAFLFMASVMLPLFLPDGMNINKLLRAQIAFILFAGAYLAEVIRGGLQALPKGQAEAGDALGLSYWKKTWLIILPQALRLVIPPLVNTFVGSFKDTSLVLIIAIFDLMTTGKTAVAEPAWQPFGNEVYVTLAVIYFVFCFAMSSYARHTERLFARARSR